MTWQDRRKATMADDSRSVDTLPLDQADYAYSFHCLWCNVAPIKEGSRYCSNNCRSFDAIEAIEELLTDCMDTLQVGLDHVRSALGDGQ